MPNTTGLAKTFITLQQPQRLKIRCIIQLAWLEILTKIQYYRA